MTQTTPQRLADPERDGTVYVRDLTTAPVQPEEATPPPAARLYVVTAVQAPALQEAMHACGLYLHDVVATRLRDGRRAYALETDGLIAAYGWVAFSPEPVGELGIAFQLEAGEAYIYDCATRPEHRGRGYYPALLRFMAIDLRGMGCRRAWIGTAPGNVASQRGIVRAGFTKVADVNVTRRVGGVVQADVYGVPGVVPALLEHAAWSYQGRAYPDAGIPA